MQPDLEYEQDSSADLVTAAIEASPRKAERRPRPFSKLVELDIVSIVVGDRGRTDLGDLTRLMRSIETIGLLHPVTVADKSNLLLAGARRLESCRRLGW